MTHAVSCAYKIANLDLKSAQRDFTNERSVVSSREQVGPGVSRGSRRFNGGVEGLETALMQTLIVPHVCLQTPLTGDLFPLVPDHWSFISGEVISINIKRDG